MKIYVEPTPTHEFSTGFSQFTADRARLKLVNVARSKKVFGAEGTKRDKMEISGKPGEGAVQVSGPSNYESGEHGPHVAASSYSIASGVTAGVTREAAEVVKTEEE